MSKRAGADASRTKECILQAARAEFLAHGFQHSSLRRICGAAGVTTGAVYFFFSGKDEMFQAVISAVTEPMARFIQDHYTAELDFLNRSPAHNEQEDFAVTDFIIDSCFEHRQTWDILLAHLGHPAVQRFMDGLADCATGHYGRLLELWEAANGRSYGVDQFDLHQFVHMQTDAIMTLVSHDFTREEMQKHAKTVTKMLRGAFYALLTD